MSVVVLGAGLQGMAITLELAKRGFEVDLVDQDSTPFNRTSLRNEGKIHLGLVYANDPSFETAGKMLDGALCFQNLLDSWTADSFRLTPRSTPFYYIVSPETQLPVDRLEEHYEQVQTAYITRIEEDGTLNYLGKRPPSLFRQLHPREAEPWLGTPASAVFASIERAIDLRATSRLLRKVMFAEPRIHFHGGHEVIEVERTPSGFAVSGTSHLEGGWKIEGEQVVNALWANRASIDACVGFDDEPARVHRLRYRALIRVPSKIRFSALGYVRSWAFLGRCYLS